MISSGCLTAKSVTDCQQVEYSAGFVATTLLSVCPICMWGSDIAIGKPRQGNPCRMNLIKYIIFLNIYFSYISEALEGITQPNACIQGDRTIYRSIISLLYDACSQVHTSCLIKWHAWKLELSATPRVACLRILLYSLDQPSSFVWAQHVAPDPHCIHGLLSLTLRKVWCVPSCLTRGEVLSMSILKIKAPSVSVCSGGAGVQAFKCRPSHRCGSVPRELQARCWADRLAGHTV